MVEPNGNGRQTRMQEGVVAFLDALGVKGIWAREEPQLVMDSWNKVLSYFDKYVEHPKKAARHVLKSCAVRLRCRGGILAIQDKVPQGSPVQVHDGSRDAKV